MKQVIAGFLIIISLTGVLTSQVTKPFSKNAVYCEMFGPGIIYSLNYEFRPIRQFSLRAGYSSWSMSTFFLFVDGWFKFQAFPITASYLTGQGSHSFEVGGGVVPMHIEIEGTDFFFGEEIDASKTIFLGTGIFGYRYQPYKGAFLKAAVTPLFNSNNLLFYCGVSIGYSF
ncbi:hypothetical protein JXL83_01700 [candidate division WOR-3 bacterium]|nr:hypothetical protein [candidate division WOR-3 bacterium]